MGFFNTIRIQYGPDVVRQMKEYSNNNRKLSNLKNRKIFLLKCRSNGITPRHVNNSLKNVKYNFEYKDAKTGQKIHDFTNKLGHKMINLELDITHKDIGFLERRNHELSEGILRVLNEYIWIQFVHKIKIKCSRVFDTVKAINLSKFNKLQEEQKLIINTQNKWIKNISSITLPEEVKTTLSLGPKFCLPPSKNDISIAHLLSELDVVVSKIENNKDKHIFISRITNVITNYCHKQSTSFHPINNLFKRSAKFLNDHPEIIVLQSDKGSVTTVMDKTKYIELSNKLLSDEEHYLALRRDPSSSYQQRINTLITNLKKEKKISKELAHKLMYYKGTASKFYGLPKIHKEELSLRPIIASINCPNYNIAEYIRDVLTKSYQFSNIFHIKDSFEFSEFINDFQLPDNYILQSWDVISLFTNITVSSTKEIVRKKWENIQPNCSVSLETFCLLIDMWFDTTVFSFNNQYFKQIQGAPMGSIASPIIAQFVVDDILEKIQHELPFELPFCKKFMDDVVTAIPQEWNDRVLDSINGVNPRIKFTIENETDRSVPFLDMILIRTRDNRIITDWYVKPMASQRYIHYLSFHPIHMKINLIRNLKTRVNRISHSTFRDRNLTKLENILTENGYPKTFLRRILYNNPDRLPQLEREENEDNLNDKIYVTLPQADSLTERLKDILPKENIKIAIKNVKPLKKLYSKLKDKTPILRNSDVVYKIPCSHCELKYIGQTSTTLQQRINLHKSNIRLKKDHCALAKHSIETGHIPSFEEVEVLDCETNIRKRTLLEMIRIAQNDDSINSKKDVDSLSSVYALLIDIDKNLKHNTRVNP